MVSKFDSRQVKNVAALPQVGSAANDTVDTILPKIDAELSKLFEDTNLLLVDGGTIAVNSGATSVSFSASLKLHVNSLVAGGSPKVIDLGSSTAAFSADGNMLYAVINRTAATATITADSSTLPAVTSANQEVILIAKRVGTNICFRNGAIIPAGRSVTLAVSDIYGSLGSTTNQLIKTNGTDGKTIQATGITVDSSNNVTGIASETVSTSIVTGVSAENISSNSVLTGSNATLSTLSTPIIKLTNASLASIDGVLAGISGQQVTLVNDTGTTILLNNDTGATTANRIYTGLSKPLSIKNTASILLKYDDVVSRWRVIGGSGSGSGSSGSGGGELADLMYSCAVRDSFSDLQNGTTTIDIAAGKTDATLHDIANELFRINYDATKTVTGTGTAITISASPSFTIKAGDMIVIPSTSESRKISSISSQTSVTIESAFSTNPSATACCISQAVHTVDLNNFTNGGQVFSAASQYSGNIDEIMLGYQDSSALADVVPDFGTAAVIAFSASTDASSWTTSRTRVDSLSSSEVPVTCNTSNPNLYLRFFSNKTSGSGAVNLLGYKVFFQKIIGQQVGSNYYTAFARPTAGIAQNCSIGLVGGKTRFTFTFPYSRGLNSGEASGSILEVIANGQVIPRFASSITDTTQAYFTEINDSTIEMDTDYTNAGIDFQFKVQRINVIDTNTQNTVKNALHDDLLNQSVDANVIVPFLTAVNSTPVAGVSFRSDITGRTSVPDMSAMLNVQFGPQRFQTQEIYQLQSEFGSAGQLVFGVVNDKFNQFRFVGGWISAVDADGYYIKSSTVGDYVEIVFYGTGLNICFDADDTGITLNYSIDGGSVTPLTIPTYATTLGARNYAANQILSIASGLTLGFHTIKVIQNSTVEFKMQGLETITETTSLQVCPGTIVKGKYENVLSSLQSIPYTSGFESGTLGTTGGCVLVYLKNNGSIGTAVTANAATPSYLTSADHTNEEIVRTYHWREFGAGRSDDFSILNGTAITAAFTLDDGVTTLIGAGVASNTTTFPNALYIYNTNNYITFTFIGSGLDIIQQDNGTSATTSTISIDGSTPVSFQATGNTSVRKVKIASGLPYGTHTVKILQSVLTSNIGINQFIVYAPKVPATPVGAIALGQYYLNANYVANTTASIINVSQGVNRKINMRETIYAGTGWSAPSIAVGAARDSVSGWDILTTGVSGDYEEYTFFGTGFELRLSPNSTDSQTNTLSLQNLTAGGSLLTLNSTNFPGLTTSSYGITYTYSTGNIACNLASNGAGISISGLALGKYKIRIATGTTSGLRASAIDVITPIHVPASNGPYVVQNTLTLGNNSIIDLRKFNKRDLIQSSYSRVSKAIGVLSTITTASTTYLPFTDISVSHLCTTGRVRISYSALLDAPANQNPRLIIRVNGNDASQYKHITGVTAVSGGWTVADTVVVNLPIGVHKIDVYWLMPSGTATSYNVQRNMIVEDI